MESISYFVHAYKILVCKVRDYWSETCISILWEKQSCDLSGFNDEPDPYPAFYFDSDPDPDPYPDPDSTINQATLLIDKFNVYTLGLQ